MWEVGVKTIILFLSCPIIGVVLLLHLSDQIEIRYVGLRMTRLSNNYIVLRNDDVLV